MFLLFSKLRNENKRKSLSPLSLASEQNVPRLYFINIKVIVATVPITIPKINVNRNIFINPCFFNVLAYPCSNCCSCDNGCN